MELTQKEKAEALEHAVINCSVEELSKLYDKLGYVEMSAPALGLACRFRGLDMVKILVKKGATFDFPSTQESEILYGCYIGQKYANYRTNYALYLLKVFRGELKGACCLTGMKFTKNRKREAGKPLSFLADKERVTVLEYLIAQKEKLSFQPEEMLFYAICAKDAVIFEELRRHGVTLSDRRVHTMTEGSVTISDRYWYEFCALTGRLADKNYLDVMQQLALEIDEKPFYYTEKMFDVTKKRFQDLEVFEYFLVHFRQDKMKKYQIIRDLIDDDILEALPIIERVGWLSVPKKRDEIIEYASENKKTEALAWLLDYKNRTADFAAEREKADKKMMRELNKNISPNSVEALKKIWSYKKREDGTLVITNYKGTHTEVTVPEKIGRRTVTAIKDGALAGSSGKAGIITYTSWEQEQQHRTIKKITLPETVQSIGAGAFMSMKALREINIPQGVEEIAAFIFYECGSLKRLTIPESVKEIGEYAFTDCRNLEEVYISEGVLKIGQRAFSDCPKLVIYCPEGSEIESYCKKNNLSFQNCDKEKADTMEESIYK